MRRPPTSIREYEHVTISRRAGEVMTSGQLSRRTLLQTGAGGLAAGVASGLAGCSAIPGLGGGADQSTKAFQNWLFDVEEVFGIEYLNVTYLENDVIREQWDALRDRYRERLVFNYGSRFGDYLPIEFGDADWTLSIGDVAVARVDHDRQKSVDALVEAMSGMAVDREDLHGYTTLVDEENEHGYALDGSHVLFYQQSYSEAGADAQIETVVGTQSGEVETLGDRDTDLATVVKRIDGDMIKLHVQPEEQTAAARGATLGSETTTERLLILYNSADEIDQEIVEKNLNNSLWTEVSFDGREVTAKRESETAEFSGL